MHLVVDKDSRRTQGAVNAGCMLLMILSIQGGMQFPSPGADYAGYVLAKRRDIKTQCINYFDGKRLPYSVG